MLKTFSPLLRLTGTLVLALSMAWLPLVAAAWEIEMSKAPSMSAMDDMNGMAMDGMVMDEAAGDRCESCIIDMAADASCPAIAGLAIPMASGGLTWPGLVSATVFAQAADADPREPMDRPPFQPPRRIALV